MPSRYVVFETPFGFCGALETDGALTRTTCYKRSPADAAEALQPPDGAVETETPVLRKTAGHLTRFFGDKPRIAPPRWLRPDGNGAFFDNVYRELLKVPAGKVLTYGELAARAGSPRAYRAVGQAMASNPLGPLVPCHRVVRSDGSLGGYSAEGGVSVKRRLLEREGVVFDSDGTIRF